MFEFLGRGRAKSDQSATDPGPSTMPMLGVHNSATQREMVRFAMHNVLKRHGIPSQWLACEVVPVHISGHGEALILQLEVVQWHDALVLHGPALQHELLVELLRFDPDAGPAHYLFTWKFSDDSNCPHTQLPPTEFWTKIAAEAPVSTRPTRPPAAPPATPLAQGAASLLDIVDDDDHGFAPTQIRETR